MPEQNAILEAALAAFHLTTGLTAREVKPPERRGGQADLLVEIPGSRRKHRFLATVKAVDRFDTPAQVKRIPAIGRHAPMLVAPYVSREIARQCRKLELLFLDAAGNAYIRANDLFVFVTGQGRPASASRRPLRAYTPAGLRLVFALLCRPELIHGSYREIASAAGVALGTVGPVIDDLEKRNLLRFNRQPRGFPNLDRLLEDWVVHYAKLRAKLNPVRFAGDLNALQRVDLSSHNARWGGEVAAEKLTQYLKPTGATIYTHGAIARLVAETRMRADANGNIEVLEAFWEFDAAPGHPDLVPPILVYADLLVTNDPRNVETAQMIYEQYIAPKLQDFDRAR